MGRTRHSSLQAKGMLPLRKDISHCIPSFPFLCRYLAHNNRQKQLFDKLPFIFVGVSCIVTLSFNSSPCHEMINEPYFSRQNARDRCTTAFPQTLSVNIEKRSIKLYITFFFLSFLSLFIHQPFPRHSIFHTSCPAKTTFSFPISLTSRTSMAQERSSTRVMAKLLERETLHRFEDRRLKLLRKPKDKDNHMEGRGGELAKLRKGTFKSLSVERKRNGLLDYNYSAGERTHYLLQQSINKSSKLRFLQQPTPYLFSSSQPNCRH